MRPFERPLIAVAGATLLLVLAACAWQGLEAGASDVNKRLYVMGPVPAQGAQQIAALAAPLLRARFFDIHVDRIQVEVAALPWIAAVNVHRRWPDSVVVRVKPRRAIAYWNKAALLAEDGAVFAAVHGQVTQALPHLSGPQGSSKRVLKQLSLLQPVIAAAHRGIAGLALTAWGGWQLTLDDGLVLRLGRRNLQQRLQRFIARSSPALRLRLQDAGYVDLRYADGFAVGGKRPRTGQQHAREGGHEQAT